MSVSIEPKPIYIAAYIAAGCFGCLSSAALLPTFIEISSKHSLDTKRLIIGMTICLIIQVAAISKSPGGRIKVFLQILGVNMMFIGIVNLFTFPIIVIARIKFHHSIGFNDWGVLLISLGLLGAAKYLFQWLRKSDVNQKGVGGGEFSASEPSSTEFHQADVPPVRHED